jgi:VWFA-related protein
VCAAAAHGQEKPKLSIEVKVVTVYATVRDKHGKLVSNLPQEEFSLDEDGRPQVIRYFGHESTLPLLVGLLVDTSLSQRTVLEQERNASQGFLDHLLRQDKDKAFLVHFDREVELLQDLTGSRSKLETALSWLELPRPDYSRSGGSGAGGSASGPHHHRGGAGTLLYDAIYLAGDEILLKQQGRKAMIVLTDGVDRGSKETLENAVESAQRADSLVYAIFFPGEEGSDYSRGGYGGWGGGRRGGRYPQPERPEGKKVLERIAGETGGRLFQVSKKQTIEQIYAEIADELRNQYSLGYTPDRENPGLGYHRIQLTVKNKDLTVQARSGYYYQPQRRTGER